MGDKYFPSDTVSIRKEGNDIVLVDDHLDTCENGILMTLGNKMTDLPENMLNDFVDELANMINKRRVYDE